jgi:hypothetical protein
VTVTIVNGYVSEAMFRAAIGDTSSGQQAAIQAAIQTASRLVDSICGRRFYKDTAATVRYYDTFSGADLNVDDFWTTTSLVVETDDGDDGTYDTAWTIATDYEVRPTNGLNNALPWPYTSLRAVGSKNWPLSGRRHAIKVTAKWGWSAVPDAVMTATILLAKDHYKRPESLTGGYIGIDGWGPARIREDPAIVNLLRPYIHSDVIFVG